ncbi:SEC-C metal-binding domain-containing protein [Syntrophomonas wolfei]
MDEPCPCGSGKKYKKTLTPHPSLFLLNRQRVLIHY